MTAPAVTWSAGNDRVAQAHEPKALRTLCGSEIVQERLAWPKFRNCMVCAAVLDQRVVPVIPETELRLLHGDR